MFERNILLPSPDPQTINQAFSGFNKKDLAAWPLEENKAHINNFLLKMFLIHSDLI